MTRVLAVAVAALAAVALYATTAPAGQQAVTPQQFAALAKRVTKLEKNDKILLAFSGLVATCLDKGAIATTKAPQYHVPAAGEAVDFYVFTTSNQDCVNIINSPLARRLLRQSGR